MTANFEFERNKIKTAGVKCAMKHFTITTRQIVSLWDAALKPSGLTGNQFNILANLAVLGETNIKGLSVVLDMDSSTLSRSLKPLEKEGFIAVRPASDARNKILSLSEKGKKKFTEASPLWSSIQESFLIETGADKWDELITGLKRIRKGAKNLKLKSLA